MSEEASGAPVAGPRVTTLELFFDLVFVFTVCGYFVMALAVPGGGGLKSGSLDAETLGI